MADQTGRIEQFSGTELSNLRSDLLQSGIDSWQASQMLSLFLAGRGYGVDSALLRDAVLRLEVAGCSIECMQAELERVALVM
ncbi:hypothetical protein [Acidipila rosea]|uniref:Uncharacterized protein n=1 Tax=Acidipila rosea TaxID=768535 RepID=A0A4R1L3R5_9BACT|nr:hypothetical protein [Acidipila rosea]MBW4026346.1 hypothetical protein [Acidobacteriota bacterium]MBW4044518.1 hypothetical protein [Acidobacteriota bacterium]TCK72696.1 hypothetical protein C7378_2284 [Acidipila rosea]